MRHAEPETTGSIGDALAAAGIATRTIHTHLAEPVPRALGAATGLVVMGGPMGVYEQARYPHLRDELALIEDALARDAAVLGVCLGSQLLAAALGARVYPGPAKELGWYPLEWPSEAARDPLFQGLAGAPLMVFHWHGDRFDPPAGTRILARSALTPIQAFASGARAYGLLCHLEITAPLLKAIVTAFADEARSAGCDPVEIVGAADRHLPALSRAARAVFGGWTGFVSGPVPNSAAP